LCFEELQVDAQAVFNEVGGVHDFDGDVGVLLHVAGGSILGEL
jgi:hypothetical protein